jgi:hypothetical protein
MDTQEIIRLARKHVPDNVLFESCARLCLGDAIDNWDAGFVGFARMRALDSLRYSLGVHSPVYRQANGEL